MLDQQEKVSEQINNTVRMSLKLVNLAKNLYELDAKDYQFLKSINGINNCGF